MPLLLSRYPFNWKNPLGYLFAINVQYIAAIYCFTFTSCLILFGIGAFLVEVTMIADIKVDLKLIDEDALARTDRRMVLNRLGDFIRNHSTIKKFSVSSPRLHRLLVEIYILFCNFQIR